MFYVGNTLWMENKESLSDIPNLESFSGRICFRLQVELWYENGELQSPQDPVTGEWMPAAYFPNNVKAWYDKGVLICIPKRYKWGSQDEN